MMATADGIAVRARALAIKPQTFRRPLGVLTLACAALLSACGGGDSPPDDASCAKFNSADVPGAGSVAGVTLRNPSGSPRSFTITGAMSFSGVAIGSAGGYSNVLLTDGQSPVFIGTIKASGAASGELPFSVDVLLQAGSSAVWRIAHAPLPAPYGWAAMRFSNVELCVR